MAEWKTGETRQTILDALRKMIQTRAPIRRIVMTPECFARLMVDCSGITKEPSRVNRRELLELFETAQKTVLDLNQAQERGDLREHEIAIYEDGRKTFLNIPIEVREDLPRDYYFCVMSGEVSEDA